MTQERPSHLPHPSGYTTTTTRLHTTPATATVGGALGGLLRASTPCPRSGGDRTAQGCKRSYLAGETCRASADAKHSYSSLGFLSVWASATRFPACKLRLQHELHSYTCGSSMAQQPHFLNGFSGLPHQVGPPASGPVPPKVGRLRGGPLYPRSRARHDNAMLLVTCLAQARPALGKTPPPPAHLEK